ncbi:unnamed protein product [Camellia sinensis]
MMESIATASKLFCCIVFVPLVLNCFNDFRSDAKLLPREEVKALETISARLQIKHFTVNQSFCSSGTFQINGTDGSETTVICNCNSTVCHVTNIRLKGLDLAGILPEEFANLSNLQEILDWLAGLQLLLHDRALGGNRINGVIPGEIGDIATLEQLVLEQNQLSGSLPEKLGNLSRLSRLVLSANNFTGTIPNKFINLKNLTDFRIDGTVLSGKIPPLIGNWTKIEKMYMQGTSMDGPIPSTISQLKDITELIISDLNGSTTKIPDLEGMKKLKVLVLRNCLITGQIPPDIGQLLTLKTLDLSFNMLTGGIPPTFLGLDKGIEFMFLTSNSLTGEVPDWIPKSKNKIDISYNNFTQSASSDQFSCQSSSVNLVSTVPPTIDNSAHWCLQEGLPCPAKPKYHDLFINCGGDQTSFERHEYEEDKNPQGESSFFSSSDKWAYSSTGSFFGKSSAPLITDNKFSLNLPGGNLYSTARLAPISLKYYGLCLRKGWYNVRLHFAEIMFSDDQKFNSLGRRIFDISIQGEVRWKDFNIMEEAGGAGKNITKEVDVYVNGSTLEIHLYWLGKGTTSIPDKGIYGPLISAISVTPNYKVHTGLSAGAIAGIVVASCVLLVLILVVLRMKGYLGGKDLEDKELRALDLQTGYFSLRQIKAATSNFDHANKIGEGGFGPVYKGVLSDGAVIAVKQLSAKSKQGNREFVNEIGMISALQHPNLVRLYGCCIEGNQLLLIYEYMENNSLARALFGREEHCLKLDWPTRKRICVGIARGLAYLHEESRLKIVHRDIKATNVLLDKDLNAKISDFGLAKLDEEENTHISTRIAGTIGYMAPEYAMRGYLTDKADVYSFGIVALEIVTGKSNTNYRPREEFVYLLDWGNLLSLVDSNLSPDYPKEEVMNMLNVALLCTNISPSLRPSMSSVVSMLEGQSPIQAPVIKRNSLNEDMRFKAFERLTQDSQTHVSTFSVDSQVQSISMDGPWIDSSVSIPSINEVRDHSSSSKLLPDLYDVNLE